MELEKDTLYISFHRPINIFGLLIGLWTIGKYCHCEFIYNDYIYYVNIGKTIEKKPYEYKKHHDIFKLKNVDIDKILEFFVITKDLRYDLWGVIGSRFLFFLNSHIKDAYFCSEWCIASIDYALEFNLRDKDKLVRYKGYHNYDPQRLFKLLDRLEMLDREI